MDVLPPQFARYRGIVDDWDAFVDALHRALPTDLRWNSLVVERERFEDELGRQGLVWKSVPGSPDVYRVADLAGPGLTISYQLGWYHPQGYTSTLPAVMLDPQPGSRVLDLCAAPGGKTSHISALMRGKGVLVANDISHHRISILASNLERLAVPNALISSYRGENYPERFHFDRVLVDAPCTGEGTYRVNGGRYREDEQGALEFMSTTQLRILRKALRVVRPGGTVLYSTCSYAPEENEEIVSALLAEADVEVLEIPSEYSGQPGVTGWEGRTYPAELARTRRFWPHHTDSWGFYCALLRRRS
jgi:NOL1/NOP2/sun family putative RNA methylase